MIADMSFSPIFYPKNDPFSLMFSLFELCNVARPSQQQLIFFLYEILLTDSDRKMTEWQYVTEAEFKAKDVSVQKLQLLVNWIVLI